MRKNHLSQEALGEAMGVSQGAVGHWLRGFREINLSDFWHLCAAAGADPREILFGETSAQAALDTLRDKVLATSPEKSTSYQKYYKNVRAKVVKHKVKSSQT